MNFNTQNQPSMAILPLGNPQANIHAGVGKSGHTLDLFRCQTNPHFDNTRIGVAHRVIREDHLARDPMADLGDFASKRLLQTIDFHDRFQAGAKQGDVGFKDFGDGLHMQDVPEFQQPLIADPFPFVRQDFEDSPGRRGTNMGRVQIHLCPPHGCRGGSDISFGDTDINLPNLANALE